MQTAREISDFLEREWKSLGGHPSPCDCRLCSSTRNTLIAILEGRQKTHDALVEMLNGMQSQMVNCCCLPSFEEAFDIVITEVQEPSANA